MMKNVIFIHIPKNAGSSILKALHPTVLRHAPARTVIEKYGLEHFQKCFSFAYVRNPWSRMVSLFHFKRKQHEDNPSFKNPFVLKNDFKGYTKWFLLEYKTKCSVNLHKGNWQQVEWLTDESGEIIVDFVGRYETINKDFRLIKKKINVKCQLPHVNKSKHDHYKTYYDKNTRDLVARAYDKDIEMFNYEF